MPEPPHWASSFSSSSQYGLRFSSQYVEIMSENLDKLIIDTPEQVQLEFPLAGIGSRFMALFVDSLIQLVAVIVFFIVIAIIGPGFRYTPELGKWVVALYIFG